MSLFNDEASRFLYECLIKNELSEMYNSGSDYESHPSLSREASNSSGSGSTHFLEDILSVTIITIVFKHLYF